MFSSTRILNFASLVRAISRKRSISVSTRFSTFTNLGEPSRAAKHVLFYSLLYFCESCQSHPKQRSMFVSTPFSTLTSLDEPSEHRIMFGSTRFSTFASLGEPYQTPKHLRFYSLLDFHESPQNDLKHRSMFVSTRFYTSSLVRTIPSTEAYSFLLVSLLSRLSSESTQAQKFLFAFWLFVSLIRTISSTEYLRFYTFLCFRESRQGHLDHRSMFTSARFSTFACLVIAIPRQWIISSTYIYIYIYDWTSTHTHWYARMNTDLYIHIRMLV